MQLAFWEHFEENWFKVRTSLSHLEAFVNVDSKIGVAKRFAGVVAPPPLPWRCILFRLC